MRIFCTFFLALVLTGAMAHAGKKFPMTASVAVPSATGDVEVEKDNNGNSKVKVTVEHLATPASLTPSETAYVVWIQERGSNDADNVGVLQIGNDLKGSLETTTTYQTFDVYVTAESNRAAKSPSGREVLKTTVQR